MGEKSRDVSFATYLLSDLRQVNMLRLSFLRCKMGISIPPSTLTHRTTETIIIKYCICKCFGNKLQYQ